MKNMTMKQRRLPLGGSALLLALALAGCGGGGGDAEVPAAAPADAPGVVPESAFASTEAYIVFHRTLTLSDRAEPLEIGNLTPPTDDRAEPVEIG